MFLFCVCFWLSRNPSLCGCSIATWTWGPLTCRGTSDWDLSWWWGWENSSVMYTVWRVRFIVCGSGWLEVVSARPSVQTYCPCWVTCLSLHRKPIQNPVPSAVSCIMTIHNVLFLICRLCWCGNSYFVQKNTRGKKVHWSFIDFSHIESRSVCSGNTCRI